MNHQGNPREVGGVHNLSRKGAQSLSVLSTLPMNRELEMPLKEATRTQWFCCVGEVEGNETGRDRVSTFKQLGLTHRTNRDLGTA